MHKGEKRLNVCIQFMCTKGMGDVKTLTVNMVKRLRGLETIG